MGHSNYWMEHMIQVSHFEQEVPVLREKCLSSCFFLKSPNLIWSWFKCQFFMNFSIRSHFLQTQCKNLVTKASNEISYMRRSWVPSSSAIDSSIKARIVLVQGKEALRTSWQSIQLIIFKPRKMLRNWIDYYRNPYCYIACIFRKVLRRAMQLSRDNLREQKVMESSFFALSESLKSKIGFIIKLSFWATQRWLKRMIETMQLRQCNYVKLLETLFRNIANLAFEIIFWTGLTTVLLQLSRNITIITLKLIQCS